MNIELNALEARVIGCLIEKQITTPDQYPLSMNALVNACNQKSNRHPLLELDERTVQQTVDSLSRKHLLMERSSYGSRVPKYQHVFCNTEFGTLKFSPLQTAIVCELLLRGPQTPAELRPRVGRMSEVGDVSEVESALQELSARSGGAIVVRLARESGRRDSRYAHLFSGPVADASDSAELDVAPVAAARSRGDDAAGRLARLEQRVEELAGELARLKQQLGEG